VSGPVGSRLNGASNFLTRSNVKCVICQFVVQSLHANVIASDPTLLQAFGQHAKSPTHVATGAAAAGAPAGAAAAAPAADEQVASFLELEAYADLESQMEAEMEEQIALEAEAESPSLIRLPSNRWRQTNTLGVVPVANLAHRLANAAAAAPARALARTQFTKLSQNLYVQLNDLCSHRMPFAYVPYCKALMAAHRRIGRGLYHGDRADQICLNMNQCDTRSYVHTTSHSAYKVEAGDAQSEGL